MVMSETASVKQGVAAGTMIGAGSTWKPNRV
jgi:hypothetical protein